MSRGEEAASFAIMERMFMIREVFDAYASSHQFTNCMRRSYLKRKHQNFILDNLTNDSQIPTLRELYQHGISRIRLVGPPSASPLVCVVVSCDPLCQPAIEDMSRYSRG